MLHAKKMSVVPKALMDSLLYNQEKQMGSEGKQIVSLEEEIQKVLNNKSLPGDIKNIMYTQLLQEYTKLTRPTDSYTFGTTTTQPVAAAVPVAAAAIVGLKSSSPSNIKTDPTPGTSGSHDVKIISTLDRMQNKRHKNKAMELYSWIKDNIPTMQWDGSGQLHDKPGTNIVDLVRTLTSPGFTLKTPTTQGLQDFALTLRKSGVPTTMVPNLKAYYTAIASPVTTVKSIKSPIFLTPDQTPKRYTSASPLSHNKARPSRRRTKSPAAVDSVKSNKATLKTVKKLFDITQTQSKRLKSKPKWLTFE